MPSPDAPPPRKLPAWAWPWVALATAGAYALAGWLALGLRAAPDYAIVVFLPAGVAAGATLVAGPAALPGVLLGSLAVQAMTHHALGHTEYPWTMLVPALGATAMAHLAAWAARRWAGYPGPLDAPMQVVRLLFAVLPLTALLNASVAVPTLVWTGTIPAADAAGQWLSWWLGDALGMVLLVPLALVLFGQPRPLWWARRYSVGLPLLVALLLVSGAVHLLFQTQYDRQQLLMQQITSQAGQALQRRLDAQLDALEAMGQLLARKPDMDQAEFEEVAELWLRRHQGTQNFTFNWRVSRGERARYECCDPGWPILGRDAAGQRFPAPDADEHIVITRLAPLRGNEAARGLDVLTYAPLREAVQQAIATGRPQATEPFRLVQETGTQRGIVVYHAVRAPTAPHTLLGIASSAFRMGDVTQAALEALPTRDLTLCLVDEQARPDNRVLAGAPDCAQPRGVPRDLVHAWPLRFAQRAWRLQVTPQPAFWRHGAADTRMQLTAVIGFAAVGLLAALLLVGTGQRRRVEQLVRERTLALAHSHAQLQQLAHYDPLTGLLNRTRWAEVARGVLDSARREQRMVAVAFMDLDRFKQVNDTLGHAQGDRLLQALAGRLQQVLRNRDVLARFGGDEFVALLPWIKGQAGAEVVARKLSQALEAPIELDGTSVRMGASIGVAIFPDDGDDLDTLLRHADTAMYAAKAAGRNQWRFFEPSMHAGVSRRLTLETALRAALANPDGAGLHLHYQPQVRAEDGRVVGVEALLRWHHPELGPLSPAEFVRVAEEAGIVDRLDHWVLQHSLAQWAQWCAQAPALLQDVRLALNVSAQELVHGTLLERVRTALATHGLGADVLEIEITESVLMQAGGDAIEQLHALQRLGVSISLDDFGTGYSSLSYLKRLPIATLKIDRSFVDGIPHDADSVAIVRATLSMAHDLDLAVVAEGVETVAQRDFLRANGCTVLQGWLFARAMPPDALLAWLRTQRSAATA
ncbi:MAG: EAL domain-containing protein [Tepidimonas ignava]|uniref:bifunctional diguanylate cyclase/phosphodiesterase n=1 Tax=Tepidimonas ignava TaxID=114249 RepID=UPI00391BEFAC